MVAAPTYHGGFFAVGLYCSGITRFETPTGISSGFFTFCCYCNLVCFYPYPYKQVVTFAQEFIVLVHELL